jgi:glyoxylase-like metal-dependent hydrolase (beta-lactamase superfamily II)
MWQKLNPPDDNNMCTWAMRCLLIEDGKRLILIDNGIGDKQDAKFLGHYYLHGNATLDKSLAKLGFSKDDITDVVLSHLHFDHCGGSICINSSKTGYMPAFKNAIYWSNEQHWQWATVPNAREKASFLKENILPIKESGQLKFLKDGEEILPGLRMHLAYGHTDAMMCPMINYNGKTVVFMADLLPSAAHVPLPYVMAYDTRPLLALEEKAAFLNEAADKEYILFLEHDKDHECCIVQHTEKGVRLKMTGPLADFL